MTAATVRLMAQRKPQMVSVYGHGDEMIQVDAAYC
jgi:hypothetical protein